MYIKYLSKIEEYLNIFNFFQNTIYKLCKKLLFNREKKKYIDRLYKDEFLIITKYIGSNKNNYHY